MRKPAIEKFTGCLIGGAIGDALGAPIEFMSLNQILATYGQRGVQGYVEFGDGFGEFTDDTQMTLFTAEGLLRARHRAMLKGIGGAINTMGHFSYLRWLHTQNSAYGANDEELINGWLVKERDLYKRRAPGNTCLSALESGIAGTIDNPINDSKGCGTIMRMAPVGLMFPGENEKAFNFGCDLSAITHGHPSGYLSGGFFASLIADLIAGVHLATAIENAIFLVKTRQRHEETLDAVLKSVDLFKETRGHDTHPFETIEQLGEGWVAEEALSISLYCSLLYTDDFERGVLYSVNHSGDCDSTGSITGNILGLINGIEAIPRDWIDKLRFSNIVLSMGEDLHTRVKGDTYSPDEEWQERYPGY